MNLGHQVVVLGQRARPLANFDLYQDADTYSHNKSKKLFLFTKFFC